MQETRGVLPRDSGKGIATSSITKRSPDPGRQPPYGDDSITTAVIFLKPGISRDAARRRLEMTFGPKYHAFAVTNGEIRAEVVKIFDQAFLITYALLAVAIVIAVLGVINTLAALILERRRDLALLRVLGMSIAEVRRMLVLESSVLGLTSKPQA